MVTITSSTLPSYTSPVYCLQRQARQQVSVCPQVTEGCTGGKGTRLYCGSDWTRLRMPRMSSVALPPAGPPAAPPFLPYPPAALCFAVNSSMARVNRRLAPAKCRCRSSTCAHPRVQG